MLEGERVSPLSRGGGWGGGRGGRGVRALRFATRVRLAFFAALAFAPVSHVAVVAGSETVLTIIIAAILAVIGCVIVISSLFSSILSFRSTVYGTIVLTRCKCRRQLVTLGGQNFVFASAAWQKSKNKHE